MSKTKQSQQSSNNANSTSIAVKNADFDPALASLFASSSGPVKVPSRPPPAVLSSKTSEKRPLALEVDNTQISDSSESTGSNEVTHIEAQPRKRRKVGNDEDLETNYLNKLVQEEEKEFKQRRKEKVETTSNVTKTGSTSSESENDETSSEGSTSGDEAEEAFGADGDALPIHESLQKPHVEADKSKRTVFLSNVSTKAIVSKSSRKMLLNHLKTALDPKLDEKLESIRFRSTAFVSGVGPKRAAYAKKELMEETAHGTNAYVVFSSEAAARKVALKLNGKIVLDRHVHVDSLANPTKTDHKRCVFVGNLPFVDEETTEQEDRNGEKIKRPRAKQPADAEEGLWQVFGKCGTIESVRVVRDKATRVGKGFAYVQYIDQNGVERALELDGKRFAPLLPRTLRVTRAKKMQKKELRIKGQISGRRPGGNTNFGANSIRKGNLDGVVFEGYRASSGANSVKLKTKSRGKDGKKPGGRSSRRGAAFKAGGRQKRRD